MTLHAHFLNEGATLILEGNGFRLGIETTDENMADCEAIDRAVNNFSLQHGGENTRTAGLVREVGPWRQANDDEIE